MNEFGHFPSFPSNTVVILLDICAKDYSFSSVASSLDRLLLHEPCPNCEAVGQFIKHASYRKYCFRHSIEIVRVRCRECGVTHALIPSFSLPGTSMGTEEAEQYLLARTRGASRARAAEVFAEHQVSPGYPKQLERMFELSVMIGKQLLAGSGDAALSGTAWIASVCGTPDRPLFRINCFALDHQVNGLCFCRRWLLKYYRNSVHGQASHNSGSPQREQPVLESG